jgi:hypothetical protein
MHKLFKFSETLKFSYVLLIIYQLHRKLCDIGDLDELSEETFSNGDI